MKFRFFIAAALLYLCATGCAVKDETPANDDAKMFFDAWMHTHFPDVEATSDGIYIIDEKIAEDGVKVGFPAKVMVHCTVRDLEGNISSTTEEKYAKQLGEFVPSRYYGPVIWNMSDRSLYKGVEAMLCNMTVGSTMTAIIPGWLQTYNRYDTIGEYEDVPTENGAAIYTIRVTDRTDDLLKWEADSLDRFVKAELGGVDSLSYGFYYKQLVKPTDKKESIHKDTTIYINYTGRLLNGQAFDTTIEQVAIDEDIHNPEQLYLPVPVQMYSDSTKITLKDNSVIPGFARTIWQMGPMEKGVGTFISPMGYGPKGNGSLIPGYSPLIFEIELVKDPKKK